MSQINLYSPTQFTTGFLIADLLNPTGVLTSSDSLSQMTQIGGVTVSACLELQSTLGALLLSRMTTAQKNSLLAANGMVLYDTTLNAFSLYEAGAWIGIPAIVIPTVVNDIPTFTNTAGTMHDSGVSLLLNGGNTNLFQGVLSGNITLTTAVSNVGFGTSVLNSITTGDRNQAFGTATLDSLTSGSDNSGFGYNSLQAITSGARNSGFGNNVLSTITTSNDNVGFGYNCLTESANAARNCAFGSGVLATLNDAVNCVDNVCAGYNNMTLATAVERTISIGSATGSTCSAAGECTFVGHSVASQGAAPAFTNLTGIGAWALHNAATLAGELTAVGWSSMLLATTAVRCTAVGHDTLSAITVSATGNDSTAVGTAAISLATTAIETTAIGSEAGASETQYTACTLIGYASDIGVNNLTNATAIGANAVVNTSNSLVLGSGANVGIGTSSPTANLHIVSGGGTAALQISGSGIIVPYRSTGSQVSNANTTDVIYQSLSTTPTIALPVATAGMAGQILFIKNNSFEGGGNYLNLVPSGGQTIDGDTSAQINGNHTGAIVYTDGSNWFIIACYGTPNRT